MLDVNYSSEETVSLLILIDEDFDLSLMLLISSLGYYSS